MEPFKMKHNVKFKVSSRRIIWEWTFQNETQCHIQSFKSKDNLSTHTLKSIHICMRIYTCLIYVTCKRYIILYSGPGFLKANQRAGQGPGVSPPGRAHPRSIFFPKVVCAACTPLSASQPDLHSSVSPWRCTIVIQQYSQNLI
jgi:hypothetical protein